MFSIDKYTPRSYSKCEKVPSHILAQSREGLVGQGPGYKLMTWIANKDEENREPLQSNTSFSRNNM